MTQKDITTPSNKKIRQALFTLYFCMGICFSTWASRIPTIKENLNLDDADWGTVLLMIPIGMVCGMAISGFVVSKFGSRRIFPFMMVAYLGSLLLIGFSTSEITLNMSLLISGFFSNFCNISLNTQAITLEKKYDKPIMASFHGGWSLAGLIGSAIGLLMSSLHIIPSTHFIIMSSILLIVVMLNIRYLQEDRIKEVVIEENTTSARNKKPESFLYWLGIVAFFGMAAEGAMSDWSGIYFTEISGAKLEYAPLGLAAYMVTMTSGRFIADKASHRWGSKRIVQASGLLISIGLFTSVLLPHIITTLIGFMIIGAGTAGIVPTIYSLAGKRTRINTSIALTIVSSVSFLGFLVGPPIIGYISSVSNLRFSYALIGVFGLLIVFLPTKMSVFRKE